MPRALKWLAGRKNDNFFLFIDSYDIHPPFDKPAPGAGAPEYEGVLKGARLDHYLLRNIKDGALNINGKAVYLSKEDIAYINSRYDDGINYADRFVGALLEKLDKLKLSEKTIVIITSEHGEELSDHGSYDRFGRKNLYDEVVRVPLLVKNPRANIKGARIKTQVQLIDIMPTVLALLGIPSGGGAQGVSLVPLLRGEQTGGDLNRRAYSEAGTDKLAVRSVRWKLISENGKYELYDLGADGAEKKDLAVANPPVVYELARQLVKWRRETIPDKRSGDARTAPLTEEMRRKLKEAGYW
jgi:arylsulfatase A-like enzyme